MQSINTEPTMKTRTLTFAIIPAVANHAKAEVNGYVDMVVHGLGLKSLVELPRLAADTKERNHA